MSAANADLFYLSTSKNTHYLCVIHAHTYTQMCKYRSTSHAHLERRMRKSFFSEGCTGSRSSHQLYVAAGHGAVPALVLTLCDASSSTNSKRGNLPAAEPARAVLSSPPVTAGSCVPCTLLLLSLAPPCFDNPGAARGCSCLSSPNWLLRCWLCWHKLEMGTAAPAYRGLLKR